MRRSLALPHRALRASSVMRSHAFIGVIALAGVTTAVLARRAAIWQWQVAVWSQTAARLGATGKVASYAFYWRQRFFMTTWLDVLCISMALLLAAWFVFRSSLPPTLKGIYAIVATPLFLYSMVVFLRGAPPAGALGRIGPEWLYGEIVLWCLLTFLYALFIFPIPFSLMVKLISLATVLLMSVAWRTTAPIVYVLIAIHSRGLLAIPAWMALGPWADYLYIVPVFAVTLVFYKGDSPDDYRP